MVTNLEPPTELSEGEAPNYPIGSVDNALRLLLLFSEQRSVRIADASRVLDVARSTAHRMVQMLQYRGFVVQNPETRAYVAGPELIRMALAVVQQIDVRTVALPVMERVRAELNETVHLGELRGTEIFFLESLESTKSVRVGQRTGVSMPAHCTASGRALLAALSQEQLHALYPSTRLPKVTETTISSRRELEAELAATGNRGYAINFGQSEPDVHSVAVPVLDVLGRARVSLAVAAPPSRLTEENAAMMADVLKAGARDIGASLPV